MCLDLLLIYCEFLLKTNGENIIYYLESGLQYSKKYNKLELISEFLFLTATYYCNLNVKMSNFYFKEAIGVNKKIIENLNEERRLRLQENINIVNSESINNQLLEKNNKIKTINKWGLDFMKHLDLESIFNEVYIKFSKNMNFNIFGIGLYDNEKHILKYKYLIKDSKRIFISDIDIINEKTLAGIVINKRYSIKIDKYSEEWRKFIKSDIIFPDGKIFDQESIIYIPLTVGNEVIGTVTVQSRESYKFSDLDFEYLKALTGYISSAINNELKTEKLIILNNKLNNLTRIDDTTNLFNKRELNRVIKLELSRAIRNKTSIAVIIIDLDYFKEYNDFYGHLKCDEIIIVLANILKSVFKRSYDFVSRFNRKVKKRNRFD